MALLALGRAEVCPQMMDEWVFEEVQTLTLRVVHEYLVELGKELLCHLAEVGRTFQGEALLIYDFVRLY